MPYVKATEPHLLETYTPEVTQAYIRSRLESVAVVISDGKCDFTKFFQQFHVFSLISRNFSSHRFRRPSRRRGHGNSAT